MVRGLDLMIDRPQVAPPEKQTPPPKYIRGYRSRVDKKELDQLHCLSIAFKYLIFGFLQLQLFD